MSVSKVELKVPKLDPICNGLGQAHTAIMAVTLWAIAWMVIAVTVLVIAAAGMKVIARDMRQAWQVRQNLEAWLRTLPLSQALDFFGVRARRYLDRTPLVELQAHIRNCTECPSTDRCHEVLHTLGQQVEALEFCPNYRTLRGLGKK